MIELNEELLDEEDCEDYQCEPSPLAKALAEGDLETARNLKASGHRIYEGPETFGLMLGATFEERPLAELNSTQINPDSLRRIVPLSEVIEKCGPLIDFGSTISLGPRPEGWGDLISNNRVLSWRDDGFGLVGDQLNDVDVRLLARDSLEEFKDAIIAGPMNDDSFESAWGLSLPVIWDESEVDPENLNVKSFRQLFLLRQMTLKTLDWNHDFELNACTKEPFRSFLHAESAEQSVEVLCAWATLLVSFGDKEYVDQLETYLDGICSANPELFPMTKAMKGVFLWLSAEDESQHFEALNGLEEFAEKNKMGAAILSVLSAWPWSEVSPDVAVGLYQSCRPFMRNTDSPYLSWLVEDLCHRMLKNLAGATLDADTDEEARTEILAKLVGNGLYDFAVPMLIKACESENTHLLEAIIEKKVHLGGHIHNGNVFVPLASAVMKSNLAAVRLLCENGADPLEKSHYGGWDSFECLRSLLIKEDSETEEQSAVELQMGHKARSNLQTLLDKEETNEDLRQIGKILFGSLKEL